MNSPSGHQIATRCGDGFLHLVAPESGAIIHSANLASDCVASGWSVTYSPSGHQIAPGCKDYFLVLVAPDSGAVIYIYFRIDVLKFRCVYKKY